MQTRYRSRHWRASRLTRDARAEVARLSESEQQLQAENERLRSAIRAHEWAFASWHGEDYERDAAHPYDRALWAHPDAAREEE